MRKGSSVKIKQLIARGLAITLCLALAFPVAPAMALPGETITTPAQPPELPVEIETELAPAASLKQAPLWKEIVQLLETPYSPVVRRPGFGNVMPPLNTWPININVLTGQPMRLRTSDGEISWDQPGALFDPNELVLVDENNVPLVLRTIIGELAADANNNLVVVNPDSDPRIPPDGTIVAVPAFTNVSGVGTQLIELDGTPITEFETPINENDFFVNRTAVEVLGKALFWDMQVGSDGIQACGSCHFHAGVDSRAKNQLNPNHLGGDNAIQIHGDGRRNQRNQEVTAGDFPFHKLLDSNIPGEPLLNPDNVIRDSNDIMSSMGVRFRVFRDIPVPGSRRAFTRPSAVGGVQTLMPDLARSGRDPLGLVFQGLRRVEPRNTPTMHSAAFNFDNFWDGRARFEFNGGSVFGAADPQFHVFIDNGAGLEGATNGHFRPDLLIEDPDTAEQPVRILLSSLASQAVGPPISDFEMSFSGRSWPKIAKKLLQSGVTPLANQLVATDDSVLGPYSNQNITPGMPGLSITYPELIQMAFPTELWSNTTQHFDGAVVPLDQQPPLGDPFDGYVITMADGPADPADTNQFTQMEANFSLFFGLSIQAYEELLIPDDTPFDRFMDANPLAANGVGQPGEQGTLPPSVVRELVTGDPNGNLAFPDPEKFGEDELFGFDIFAGANLTAALPVGSPRNPDGFGSNPFMRTGRCMICHLGPEQTDASISIAHGFLLSNTEFEFPTPPTSPEPTGPMAFVTGFLLAEELEGTAQDAVEVEPRDMAMFDDPATPYDDRIIAVPSAFAFGDQGIYNVGVRPISEDIGRGGDDPFAWPLSRSALAMKNLEGPDFDPPDDPSEPFTVMSSFDPALGPGGGLYEETGGGAFFPGTVHTLQSINPGLELEPTNRQLPAYLAPWVNNMPAAEAHPQIDELAFAPNTISEPNGGPALEFGENLFGSDLHCGLYDPATFGAGPPNFGWGPTIPGDPDSCPNSQSGVPNNFDPPLQGTWTFANRVARNGAFKAPQLRNIELTGPYFHTGSYLTLRQVVDFYLRGGDFPVTNAEGRDAHLVDVHNMAFGFGATTNIPPGFADAIPDAVTQYDAMPDADHPVTPEPATSTPEEAANALVKLLLAMTDERVQHEMAPFDRPEMFVPIDGRAPTLNRRGRERIVTLSDPTRRRQMFMQLPAVGETGHAEALQPFLEISSTPVAGSDNDHFDR